MASLSARDGCKSGATFIIGPDSDDEVQLAKDREKRERRKEEREDRRCLAALEDYDRMHHRQVHLARVQRHHQLLAAAEKKAKASEDDLSSTISQRMQALSISTTTDSKQMTFADRLDAEYKAKLKIQEKERALSELAGEYRSLASGPHQPKSIHSMPARPSNIPSNYPPVPTSASDPFTSPLHKMAQKMALNRAEKRVQHQLKKKELSEEGVMVEKGNDGLSDDESWEEVDSDGEQWEKV